MKVIGFHNPEEKYGFLSNWYLSEFQWNEILFTSMEQFMMYRKAVCFRDKAIAEQILKTRDVAMIKELGRQVSGYTEHIWNGVRQLVVYEGLMSKFSQNPDLQGKLMETGDSILAECAVKDKILGIGLSMKDPGRLDLAQWRGQNLLGYALMMVREQMKRSNG